MARRYAAADIGSNTAHLLIADVDGSRVRRIINSSDWLSLGQIVAKKGSIPSELEGRLVSLLCEFKDQAEAHEAESIYVFATEAVRSAKGFKRTIARLNSATGLEIEVIGPEREAELALHGAMIDMPTTRPSHFIEVGGGSAQVAYWHDGTISHEMSLPIGTGVLMARHGLKQPADKNIVAAVVRDVHTVLDSLDVFPTCSRLVVSGGVARGIWRALHPDGEPNIASRELEYLEWACRRLNVGQIERRFHVKEKRAATMLAGSIVYRLLMDRLQHKSMRVSMFGVREGAVLKMASGEIDGTPL